jgi:hypothetical protein
MWEYPIEPMDLANMRQNGVRSDQPSFPSVERTAAQGVLAFGFNGAFSLSVVAGIAGMPAIFMKAARLRARFVLDSARSAITPLMAN